MKKAEIMHLTRDRPIALQSYPMKYSLPCEFMNFYSFKDSISV